jgi:cyclopropane fatty-acyl-phospholipid synthase-like methyltransferase
LSTPDINFQDKFNHERVSYLFDLYTSEAKFFVKIIENDIREKENMDILEVGCGIGLLSVLLSQKNNKITALDPLSFGFEEKALLRPLVKKGYPLPFSKVNFIDLPVEDFSSEKGFDYIFSINTLEHVTDTSNFLTSQIDLLNDNPNSRIRTICPNYTIPYEPHFNFLILFNKEISNRIYRKKISSSFIDNPLRFYDDLNFVKYSHIKSFARKNNLEVVFSRFTSLDYLDRVLSSKEYFRKKKVLFHFVYLFRLFFYIYFKFLPFKYLPILDFTISAQPFKRV